MNNYIDKVFNNWKVIKKVSTERYIARCLLCNKEYEVRIYDLINGKSKQCRFCANDINSQYKEGTIINDWEIVKRVNYRKIDVKCKLCGYERSMRPEFITKNVCGCKLGLVYDGKTFNQVLDLYNYLYDSKVITMTYPKFTNKLKKMSLSDLIDENNIAKTKTKDACKARYEGKVFNNWRIDKYKSYNSCTATCLLCNRTYFDMNARNIVNGSSTKCGVCNGTGMNVGTMRLIKLAYHSDKTGIDYFMCKCKKCGYEDILTYDEMLSHKCVEKYK